MHYHIHDYIYSGASLIRTSLTSVLEPIHIPQQKVTHLSVNSVIRTVSLGTVCPPDKWVSTVNVCYWKCNMKYWIWYWLIESVIWNIEYDNVLLLQDREKQEQLSELLNTYSNTGIPPMPDLLTFGTTLGTESSQDDDLLKIESHWSALVDNASVSWCDKPISMLTKMWQTKVW